jgi:hypothetical protein
MRRSILLPLLAAAAARAQSPAEPSWPAVEAETLEHFEALVRMDTSDPPGNEKPAADYLKRVLEREGIAVTTFAKEPHRPNVVARLPGSGAKRPLLILGHLDVVNVDPSKWQHPPFSAVRDGGYIYGRVSMAPSATRRSRPARKFQTASTSWRTARPGTARCRCRRTRSRISRAPLPRWSSGSPPCA